MGVEEQEAGDKTRDQCKGKVSSILKSKIKNKQFKTPTNPQNT